MFIAKTFQWFSASNIDMSTPTIERALKMAIVASFKCIDNVLDAGSWKIPSLSPGCLGTRQN